MNASVQSGSDVLLTTSNGSIVIKNTNLDNVAIDGNVVTYNMPVSNSIVASDEADNIYINGSLVEINNGSNSEMIGIGSNATISAGAGDDNVYGWSYGSLNIDAGSGNDTVYNYNGHSTVNGGAGNDYIFNNSYEVSINGGAGNDTIENSSSYSTLFGGEGIDTLVGQNSIAETFVHSADTDIIFGFGYERHNLARFWQCDCERSKWI